MKPPSHRQAILRQVAEGRLSPKEGARLLLEPASPSPGNGPAESPAASAQASTAAADSAIAIIGYAGQFPGARDVREFWENLAAGQDSVTTAPVHREAWRGVAAGQYHGGFLEQYDLFDPLFFNISPKEAEVMDPQQRLFLLEACRALADAGYSRDALKGSRTGVFAGCQGGDYVHLLEAGQVPDSYGFLGNLASILPARVAYFFDFKGPCMAVDTACSSSLVAVHLASESLRKGESELALAGGVSVLATPRFHEQATASEMLAPDGRCKTFDAAADGFVPAEGVGVVVLKRLDKALADGDSVRGIIRGSAINQDGRSNGISAPNGPSQSALECAVYEAHGIDPATLGYVEAHGTGTRLGDPIEFDALTEAFRRYTDQKRFCAIGSVKSNIGHALTASGVAGLIKLLLCLKHRELVPSLHFRKGNGSIDFENSPFYVNTRRAPWHPPAGLPRRAAISAFGLSGTNCHIVIEEPAAPRPAAGSEWPWPGHLIALSARTDTALARLAADLKAWLEGVGQTERLIDIAFTLQVGRDVYPYRLAFVVRDHADLLARLAAAMVAPPVAKASAQALDEAAAATARHWLESGANGAGTADEALERLHRLAELYRLGHVLPWEKLYAGRDCRRVSLPGYPFDLRRCWLPRPDLALPDGSTEAPVAWRRSAASGNTAIKLGLAPLKPSPFVLRYRSMNGEGFSGLGIDPLTLRYPSTALRTGLRANGSIPAIAVIPGEHHFEATLTGGEFFLADHLVRGRKILPAAAYIDLVLAAGHAAGLQTGSLRNLVWSQPIDATAAPVEIHLSFTPQARSHGFEVRSGDGTLHAQGQWAQESATQIDARLDITGLRAKLQPWKTKAERYALFKRGGIEYGPTFQVTEEFWRDEHEALARLVLPPVLRPRLSDFPAHPALLDGILQTVIGLVADQDIRDNTPCLPFTIGELVGGPLPAEVYVRAVRAGTPSTRADLKRFDIDVADTAGTVVMSLRDFAILAVAPEPVALPMESADQAERLYFEEVWEAAPPVRTEPPAVCLLIDADGGTREALRAGFVAAGQPVPTVILAKPGAAFGQIDAATYEFDADSPEDYSRLLATLADQGRAPGAVVHLLARERFATDRAALAAQLRLCVHAFLYLSQALLRRDAAMPRRLFFVYTQDRDEPQPHYEAMAALIRTVALENRHVDGRSIQVAHAPAMPEQERSRLLAEALRLELATETGERDIRWLDGIREARRLREFTPESSAAPRVRPGGVYLITGGLGAIALSLAAHLARAGAKLALVGRSYPDSRQQNRLNTLNGPGTPALYWRADVADEAQVRRVVAQVRERFGRIDGVFHCAGVHRDAYLVNKTARELDEVLASKVFGTVNLDQALGDAPLDFFCLASSASAVAGNIGQGDYAYANRFMDAYADWRRARNRPGLSLSINWPYWQEGGMRVDPEAEKIMVGQWRMSPLSNRAGLEIFDTLLAGARGRVMVAEGDGEAIRAHFGVGAMRNNTAPASLPETHQPAGEAAMNADDLRAGVEDTLRSFVSQLLKIDPADLDSEEELSAFGIDSINLTRLTNRINERYGLTVLPTLFFEHHTLRNVAEHLLQAYPEQITPPYGMGEGAFPTLDHATENPPRRNPSPEPPGERVDPVPPGVMGFAALHPSYKDYEATPLQTPATQIPIAIIGLAGVMPQSASLDEFWSHLVERRSLITEVPPERWDWREHYGNPQDQPGKTLSRWGGFLREADQFDAPFFNIAPREAELMDPQQRLYLECVWSAIEDAGYRPASLAQSKTGVFTGVCTWDYHELLREHGIPVDAYLSTGAAHSVVSNRVSYLLDLHGPSETVDTACSSSLVAIHRAVQALQSGHCELAIAGGVQIMATPSAHISFDRAGMLSRQGRARPFDAEADGYVRGEGVGVVLLKPLDRALRDGDPIRAVIRGTATNHGGKANSFTAPNPQAQAEVIAEAWQRAGLSPATATYIEAHGTGTKLGDPVEMNGLNKAFQQLYEHWGHPPAGDGRCAVGSVKANIGHLEAAAGIAGVIKVVLAFRHGTIPGIAHFREANPLLQLDNSPFRLAEQTAPWPRLHDSSGQALPRRAGISSFGFGGTNAHLVLEEFLAEPEAEPLNARPVLILLSAVDEDRLRAYARRLADWLDKALHNPMEPVFLRAIAHTLHAGRTAMEERLALIAADPWRLLEMLRDWADTDTESADLFRGSLTDSKGKAAYPAEHLRSLAQAEDWRSLALAWTQGADLAQIPLYPDAPRRIALPTYPFARHRYWVPRPATELSGFPLKVRPFVLRYRSMDGRTFSGSGFDPLTSFDAAQDRLRYLRANGSNPDLTATRPAAHAPETFMGMHPLLDGPAADAAPGTKYTKLLRREEFFLADHRITDRLILPGVAHIEMARAACAAASGQRVAALRNIVWIRPIVLETPTLAVNVELTEADDELAFEITHRAPDGARILFTQGKAVLAPNDGAAPEAERLDVADILARCPMHRTREDYYRLLRDVQFDLGPSFQVIRDMRASPDEVLTLLELPPHLRGERGFSLHPSLLDGAIQTVAGVTAQRLKARYLPFTLGRFEILKPLPERLYAHARLTQTLRQGEAPLLKFAMRLADEQGEVCVRFHDFIAAPFNMAEPADSLPAGELLRLKPHWQAAARESLPAPRDGAAHAWVLFAADEASARTLRERFAQAGAAHILVARPGTEFRQIGPADFLIRPDEGDDYARLLRETGGRPVRLVHAWSHPALRGGADAQAALKFGPISVFLLCRELARIRDGQSAELLYVYPWAKHVLVGALAGLGGLARTLRQEMPWLDVRSVGLACGGADDFPGVLADAAPNLAGEFGTRGAIEIRYQGPHRSVKQWVEVEPEDFPTSNEAAEASVFHPDGVYLITGGMGSIGLLLAEHITAVAGARVVLAGRSAPDTVADRPTRFSKPGRSIGEPSRSIEQAAGRIRYVQADVSDRDQTRRLLDDIRATEGRLDGVIHAAGFLRDGLIATKDAADFAAVLTPKILGALHLDEAAGSGPLDFFLCCSSIAALLGNAGQGDYALANLAMDEFMQWREEMRRFGLRSGRSLSIDWPLWEDGAMGTDATAREVMKTALGLEPLDTASALDALEQGLRGNLANFAVLRGERAKLLRAFGVTDPAAPAPIPAAETIPALDEPPAQDLARRVEAAVRDLAARIIKAPIEKLPANRELTKLGFDSITLTELANGLNKEIGLELTPAVFFEHASLGALAAYLSRDHQAVVSRKFGKPPEAPALLTPQPPLSGGLHASPAQTIPSPSLSGELDVFLSPPLTRGGREGFETRHSAPDWNEPIAIVGMSGAMPGSRDLDEFWENLAAGRHLVREVPPDRWDWREYYGDPALEANKTNIKWGGFMPEVDKFDAAFFEISPREARLMDPQQRLFLETAWAAVEDAGYRMADLSGTKIGLFVGVASLDYMEMLRQYQVDIQAHTSTGISHAVLVNRVSYLLNLSGPSEPTDTACSSSLVAFHRAIEAIHGGTCDAALVGGVNALLNPTLHISFGKAGMLAVDGKCKTFDASADGYVRGEGVGAVFLKRLRDAERDGDDIRAVIRGSFVNHGGRATSLTAPNPAAQAEVITRAWERSGLDPATVSYIEAHGTGTKLGDPVEINGLKRAFSDLCARLSQDAPPENRCGLGSVKSNIGHLETAAGIASVLKVVLALRNGVLPKTLHVQTQNPYIDLGGSPFYLVTETTPWQRPRDARGMEIPRRAGISGFGFGGANAHLVLEEYRYPAEEAVANRADGPVLIILSARTPARLLEAAARLHAYVAKATGGGGLERGLLTRIAHTLQCGREAMEERLAFTAADLDELARKLKRYGDAPESFADGWRGRSEHGGPFDAPVAPDEAEQRAIEAWLAERALIPLAEAWCRGAAIDWRGLYSGQRKPRRLSLPTYPFERRAYWFQARKEGAAKVAPESKPIAAPIPATPPAAASVASASAQAPVALRKLGALEPAPDLPRAVPETRLRNPQDLATNLPNPWLAGEPSVPESKPAPTLAAAVPVAVKSDPPPRRNHSGTSAMSHAVRQKLQHIVVETLYLGDDCDLNKEFVHLGADSVLGVEIIRRVNAAFGLAIPSAKLYEFPNIKRLAEYVASQLPDPAASAEPESEPTSAPEPEAKPSFTSSSLSPLGEGWGEGIEQKDLLPFEPQLRSQNNSPSTEKSHSDTLTPTPLRLRSGQVSQRREGESGHTPPEQHAAEAPIAVIGMAGRFPGARDAEAFWRLLAEGRSGVVEVPPTRWDYAEHYDPTGKADAKTLSKWGGFLDGIDEFDPLFFGIAPAEAELMDPQQRLFLQVAYHALEHAGHAGASSAGSRCGVFVGVGRGDYGQHLIRSRKNLNAYAMMGLNSSILAARIAYWLNLTGPSLALDTACSSALVAVHQACRSIRAGESDLALAGGACVLTTPDTHIMTSKAGMLSPDGLCRPFDAKANGFVPAEGVGVIVLKDLRRALSDGDTIHGVILGSGMNQDGRTNGITAPSGASQRRLIREVHQNSGIAPGRIGYMETHGTGTPLGDPIEIQALVEAYGDHGGQGCVLGSVKANIGHALEAAGMAGLFKLLLALRHRQLPPQIQFGALNPHISLAGSPFRINTQLEPWESSGPRAAAISSFGFSGTNCHLVMEEAPPARPAAPSAKPAYLFALSGRNPAALRQRIADLGAWLDAEGGQHDLAAISYSLNAGRGHFAARYAVAAGSVEELRSALAAAEGSPNFDAERRGGLGPAMEEFMAHLIHEIADHTGLSADAYRRKLLAVADLYMQGGEPDWDALHGGAARRRIPLPLYPYAREKYWVPEPDAGSPDAHRSHALRGNAAWTAPAVRDAGASPDAFPRRAWERCEITCRLSERDYHTADHRVGPQAIMPGAALLELAREQGAALSGRRVVALADNAWLSPLELSAEPREIRVEIVPAGEGAGYFIRSGDTLHAQGRLVFDSVPAEGKPPRRDLAAIQARCRESLSGAEIYAGLRRAGLNYGPAYRPIQTLWIGENEALAELRLPPELAYHLDRDGLHPSLLDGALQTVAGLLSGTGPDSAPRLPFGLERLSIHAPLAGHCYVHARRNPDGQRYDIGLFSPTGETLLELRGFLLAPSAGRAEAQSTPESSASLAFFRPEWAEAGPADGQAWADGPLLVFLDRAESLGSRAELLAAAGPGPVCVVYGGEAFGWDGGAFTLRPDRPEDYAALVSELHRRGQLPARVLHLWTAPFQAATHGGLDAALTLGAHSVMHFLRALYREQPRSALHIVFAHPRRDDAAGFAFAAMGSLLKSFGYECPGFSFRTVDYPGPGLGYRPLLDEFRAGPGTEIRYQGGTRLARRFRAFAAQSAPLPLRQGGVYLITGGLGDLGLLVAEHLARSAVGVKLILVGRSAPSRTEALHALEALGAKVMVATADVSQREQVYALVRQARARFGTLHGVIHGAGVIRDATLLNKDAAQAEAVWAPKVHGTLFLDEATASDELDFFVLFSSVAAVLGNVGQCDYAFANGFMDGFAAWRQNHRPGRTLSLNWPLWRDCAQGRDELVRAQYERSLRLPPLETRAALDALAAALGTDAPQVLVLDQPDAALTGHLAGETVAAPPAPAATRRAGSAGASDILATLKRDVLASIARILKIREDDIRVEDDLSELGLTSISLTQWNEALRREFRLELQPTFLFGHRTVEAIAEALFERFGAEIGAHYQAPVGRAGIPMPDNSLTKAAAVTSGMGTCPTYPTSSHAGIPPLSPSPAGEGWGEGILKGISSADSSSTPVGRACIPMPDNRPAEASAMSGMSTCPTYPVPSQPDLSQRPFASTPLSERPLAQADIAIIGLSGRMPGAASLDDFWAKLEQGADLVGEVPPERWDWRAQGGSPAVKWGGFMDGVDWFDARFFGISPREAALMDPQQRLFLEAVWHAIEDAGHRPDNLCTGKVGLFVGVSGWDYAHLMADAKTEVGAHVSTGISHSVLANRISYLLDLKGPSEPVDTACSSSLVAIHRAAQAIRHGECAAAIAGGVHVILNPAMHQSFDKAGMLSPDGRCKTFDASADGYVRGEGVGAIVLKPLAQAEADGDHIYAVIKGSAINHGGHVSSLTVPNPKAQAEVIVEAMEQARIDPATVTYIEVHGTGTALGDPVEVEGLKSAYAALYRRWGKPVPAAPHCALGTVKTQVGHLEAAAGIAGLIKLLLSLKHRRLPGIAHFRALNPVIELQATPFEIAATPRPWPAGRDASGRPVPRRAGISSFGFGGVNAHVVLEEYAPAPVVPAAVPGPVSITLSAINPERLKASAAALLAYLEHTGSGLPALADIAFTLQAGRVAQVERLGLVVSSHDELREKLRAYLRGESVAGPHLANARAARGQVTGAEARIEALIAGHNLDELTRLWTLGADIPWERLCRNPRRVALPGYPFERVRYWFDAVEAGGDARPSAPEPVQSPVSAGAVPTGKAAGRIRLVKTAEYSPDAVFSPAAEDADKTGAVFEAAPVCHPESDKTDAVSETASVYARHTESRLQPAPELSTAPSPADTQRIRAALIQQLAKVLYLNAQDIDATTPFQELGMDSILGVEFINKLNQSLGLGLKAAELYAHPSAESLAAYLAGLAPSSAEPAPSGEKPCGSGIQPTTTGPDHGLQPTPASAETAIAIIGLSGRYPQSDDLDALWENLKAGRNCITEVPPERWDASRFYDPEKGKAGKSCSKWGGFISDVDKFDPLLFNIPPVEARTMDPQERLFLETAWQTFENAGYPRARLRKLQDEHGLGIGVFVGAMASQYSFVHPDHDTGALYSMIHHWTIANRTSYFFDLRGPSFVVDTACSSSLLALHMACESLRRGESLMALAGGVNLLLHPSKYLGLNQIGVLGSQPRSRSLGLSDGYVPGEGVGAALLKPLALAERDGDRILGVIRGSFANHGGATNGFGVPNPKAQADLIVRALRNAGVDPRTLGYVEVAANGSPVGDAIEIDALNRAFQQFTDERRFCAIGSVKANIGHLEPASGISQLTKVLLQLRHGKIVPSINAEPANPDVNLEDSPFYLPQQTGEWPRRVLRENGVDVACPRRAAINSFGIGGTNVQLIVEEYPTPALAVEDRPAATGKVRCFPLSARDPSALRRQVAGLRAYLGAAEPVPLDRLAATLQSHREPLAERLAILARTEGGLRQALDDYLAGFNDPAAYTLHTGRRELQPAADDPLAAPDLPARLEALVEAGEWERVAALWVRGANVPWPQAGTGTPLELPTYPFERRVCWFSSTDRPAIPQPALEDFQISRRGEFIRPQGNNTGRINSPLQAPPQTKTENALENLTCLVADILELEPAKLDPAEPLLSYGVDSIVLMRIRNRLKESHGFDLEPARLAELNTLRRLAEALAAAGGDTASPAPSTGLREVRLSLDGGPEASRTESEVERLIAELVGKGIALDAPGGELRLRGAESALDAATLAAVSGVKQTLARYLAGRKFQPLSACQKRYWTLSLLQTQKSAYINPMSIHLAGELDVAALELALRLAMDRNEVLRAVYPALHRQPVQVIAPVPWRGGIPMEDFSALPEAEARLRLDCLTTEESATPINPKTGPNVRLRLVRLNPSEHVLLITAHHVLFDGYAFEPFLRQVFEDYEALRQGQAPRRREITQYVEFTLEEGRRGAELSDQRGYWRAVLRDAPGITPLPLDRPRPAANSFSGDSIVRVIPARIIDALKPWLNARQASLFTGLLAVFAVAMGRWTGERRLVIGTTAQNRDRRDFEDVIGDFTNFIPLVMAMEPGASLEDLVGATKRTVEQALIHKALPFDEMIPMAPEGPANVNPIYNVHVNHLPPHRPARINDRLGAEFRNNRALNRSAMLDLRFEWFEAPDGFHVICEYNTDLFERTTIERLLGLFETTLAELAANPAAPIEAARENPAPLASRPTPVQPTQPERSPQAIMAELRTVYAELLSIDADHIGADDSFLALGGNSMLAVQLVTEIEERFVPITASDIFEHSSVRQMAGLIAERLGLARTPPPREAAPPPAEPNRQETFYRLRRLNKAG